MDDPKTNLKQVTEALGTAQAAFSDYLTALRNLAPEHQTFWIYRGILGIMAILQDVASLQSSRAGGIIQDAYNKVMDIFSPRGG